MKVTTIVKIKREDGREATITVEDDILPSSYGVANDTELLAAHKEYVLGSSDWLMYIADEQFTMLTVNGEAIDINYDPTEDDIEEEDTGNKEPEIE